jgi:membrane-associated protease RseP (regulator of RpoE activity)
MAYTVGVIVFLIGATVTVALHELGHMLPAKRFGVRVPQYMIGFGPTLWSRKRGDTEYGIKAFPLGGYVRLMGMIPPADEVKPVRGRGWAARLIEDTRATSMEEMKPGEEHRAFYRLPWQKRAIVMSGGILANLLIAVIIFTGIGLFYGEPRVAPAVGSVEECVLPYNVERECTSQDPDTAALLAGFEAGDRVLAVDGTAIDAWAPLHEYIRDHPGKVIAFTVLRSGEEITIAATPTLVERPAIDSEGEAVIGEDGGYVMAEVGFLGVQPLYEVVPQGPFYGVTFTVDALGQIASTIYHLPEYLWDAGRAAFGYAERDPNGIISIVGAGRIAGEIATVDDPSVGLGDQIAGMLTLVGAINLALFAFNLIPLLPLDGGHVAGAFWQGIKDAWARAKKRPKAAPVDLARTMPVTYVMFVLLILMGALLIYADIVAPVQIG